MPSGHAARGNYERPLSRLAWDCLAAASREPYPSQEINFGIADKLVRMGYAEYQDRPSPYKSHRAGQTVPFLVVTAWGRLALDGRSITKEP